jgi:predicted transcriptional regulator of viral defense system
MPPRESSLATFIDGLQRQAHYSFTRAQAARATATPPKTVTKALQRLKAAGRIHRVRQGFYTIVPLEHADAGSIPTDWFIADLMRFLGIPYYVGVLTAAAYHGAAHQQPQEFQVVVTRSMRTISTGKTRIRFLRYGGLPDARTQPMKSFTSVLPVSTPEQTAFDLVRFQRHIGGFDAVMTVLAELTEKLSDSALLLAARREPSLAQVQRLGWLLDRLGARSLARELAERIERRSPAVVPLNGSLRSRRGSIDRKWRLIVNDEPESEL